ncbi:hypothetical protein MMC28_002334 [Mycoblastus sanguinarius]|nr:hypothetical protein [Mycoblastus sanguinarius]
MDETSSPATAETARQSSSGPAAWGNSEFTFKRENDAFKMKFSDSTKIKAMEGMIKDLESDITRLEYELEGAQTKNDVGEAKLQSLTKTTATQTRNLMKKDDSIKDLEKDLADSQTEVSKYKNQLSSQKGQFDKMKVDYNDDMKRFYTANRTVTANKASFATDRAELQKEIGKLTQKIHQLQSDASSASQIVGEKTTEVEILAEAKSNLEETKGLAQDLTQLSEGASLSASSQGLDTTPRPLRQELGISSQVDSEIEPAAAGDLATGAKEDPNDGGPTTPTDPKKKKNRRRRQGGKFSLTKSSDEEGDGEEIKAQVEEATSSLKSGDTMGGMEVQEKKMLQLGNDIYIPTRTNLLETQTQTYEAALEAMFEISNGQAKTIAGILTTLGPGSGHQLPSIIANELSGIPREVYNAMEEKIKHGLNPADEGSKRDEEETTKGTDLGVEEKIESTKRDEEKTVEGVVEEVESSKHDEEKTVRDVNTGVEKVESSSLGEKRSEAENSNKTILIEANRSGLPDEADLCPDFEHSLTVETSKKELSPAAALESEPMTVLDGMNWRSRTFNQKILSCFIIVAVLLFLATLVWAFWQGTMAMKERRMWLGANNIPFDQQAEMRRQAVIGLRAAAWKGKKVGWLCNIDAHIDT